MKRNAAVALLALVLTAAPLVGQTLDQASSEALAATLRMLLDPSLRGTAIAGNPQAGAVDAQIQALTGSPALTQELYAVAADVFRDLTQGAGGDVRTMSEALERGKVDPASFAAMLSPATLARLRGLATKISDEQGRRP